MSSDWVGVVLVDAAVALLWVSQADDISDILGCTSWAWAVVADAWVVVLWKFNLVESVEGLHLQARQLAYAELWADW